MFGRRNLKNRNRWLETTLSRVPSGSTLLDAGAGEGANSKFYSHTRSTKQDICIYDGIGDGTGLHTGEWDTSVIDLVCPIEDMPIEDGAFDTVLCTEVLEHLPNAEVAIQELVRVLKPGGKLILTAPFASMVHFSPHFYSTGFSNYFYEYCFKKFGCGVLEVSYNGDWYECLAQELLRLPSMGASVFEKALAVFSIPFVMCIYPFILLLSKLSKQRTSKIMCFGLHIIAVKK
jgi:ubiquinone/menaquinone biosynthesis C-methylase UbiE